MMVREGWDFLGNAADGWFLEVSKIFIIVED
jgi:hypothetical protein